MTNKHIVDNVIIPALGPQNCHFLPILWHRNINVEHCIIFLIKIKSQNILVTQRFYWNAKKAATLKNKIHLIFLIFLSTFKALRLYGVNVYSLRTRNLF